MKFNKEILEFLKGYIDISEKEKENGREKSNTLIQYLNNNLGFKLDFTYQGSFGYETIIKPGKDEQYDVDLAVKMNYREEFEGSEQNYHNIIIECLEKSDKYSKLLNLSKERAIRLNYKGENEKFFIDLVPMVYDKNTNTYKVINRFTNELEISGGDEFKARLNEQNNKLNKHLKRVIRFFKYFKNKGYLKDIRSVQLTLLLARQVDKISNESLNFIDTLYFIGLELKNELSNINFIKDLDLSNPGLKNEIFDRNFSDIKFLNFKQTFTEFFNKIETAYLEEDEEKSAELRNEILGVEVIKINKSFYETSKLSYLSTYFWEDYKHAEHPNYNKGWNYDSANIKRFNIKAYHSGHGYGGEIPFKNGQSIRPSKKILFYAVLNNKNLIRNVSIFWQITNQDTLEIRSNFSTRGEIGNERDWLGYNDRIGGYGIKETTMRAGKHCIKCYVINNRNEVIAESEEFYVIID